MMRWFCCGAPKVKEHVHEPRRQSIPQAAPDKQQSERVSTQQALRQQPATAHGLTPFANESNNIAAALDSHLRAHGSQLHPQQQLTRPPSEVDDYLSCRDDFSVTDGAHLLDAQSLPHPAQSMPRHSRHSSGSATLQASTKLSQQEAGTPVDEVAVNGGHLGGSIPDAAWHQQRPLHHSGVHTACTNGTPSSSAQTSSACPTQLGKLSQEPACRQSILDESESDTAMVSGDANPIKRGLAGCLNLLDNLSLGSPPHSPSTAPLLTQSKQAAGSTAKPDAGCSMQRRDLSKSVLDVWESWEDAGNCRFNLRSQDYMKSKVKVASSDAMYRLVCADIFACSTKQDHIAKLVNLPASQNPVMAGDVALPPLLIFNLQLPLYQATLFGPLDGEGVSIVLCFALPPGFDPAKFQNQKALALMKRFVQNGREEDGHPTRDRLKLIPRVVNIEEWVRKGPLSPPEHKLLVTYNEKPILSRPQHAFYTGRRYLEVDLDLHKYTYLARRAITSYLHRLPYVIWEIAFVIQGNGPDELPEHLLAASRIYRFDFSNAKNLSHFAPVPKPAPGSQGKETPAESPPGANGLA
ncbi:hypothetical protein V8C86DRAFT_2626768 [Haematococcus lacustris]